jgi:hypothetical protein
MPGGHHQARVDLRSCAEYTKYRERNPFNQSVVINVTFMIDSAQRQCRPYLLKRVAVLFLLLTVPSLSTLAKNSWYLPQADAGHYLTGAVKMRVAHSPELLDTCPLRLINKVISPQPQIRRHQEPELAPEIPSISVTVALQHRSPPALLT